MPWLPAGSVAFFVGLSRWRLGRRLSRSPLIVAFASSILAGCTASIVSPQASLSGPGAYDPRLGVRASEKLIPDDRPVPHGGGYYLVGKPYVIAGKTYYPSDKPYRGIGTGSWYGIAFRGRKTANGEIFDTASLSAAHPTMPLPSYARVTNLANDRSVIVRVNDRGPYHDNRVMDVSEKVAEVLDYKHQGTTRLRVEYIGKAALAGSNDEKLLASLRADGGKAVLDRSADEGPVDDTTTEPPSPATSLRRNPVRTRGHKHETIADLVAASPEPDRHHDKRESKKGNVARKVAGLPGKENARGEDDDVPVPRNRPRHGDN